MPMRPPRSRRISSCGRPMRFLPSNQTSPEISALGSSPITACVNTLLPEPDSPAMPNSEPGRIANETLRTACTVPSSVGISTVRPFASRIATSAPILSAEDKKLRRAGGVMRSGQPPHPPAGTFSPTGRRQKREGWRPFPSPHGGEGGSKGRMRGFIPCIRRGRLSAQRSIHRLVQSPSTPSA